MDDPATLTALIKKAVSGDAEAYSAVFDETYEQLKKIARNRMRHADARIDLDTTGLVHESYLRLVNNNRIDVSDRRHFYAYAGRIMRSVVVDAIRERQAQRRGGDVDHLTLNTGVHIGEQDSESEVLGVHEVLEKLAALDEQMVSVVEMRYFAGMTTPEIAEGLQISERTVRRTWQRARLWLADALGA